MSGIYPSSSNLFLGLWTCLKTEPQKCTQQKPPQGRRQGQGLCSAAGVCCSVLRAVSILTLRAQRMEVGGVMSPGSLLRKKGTGKRSLLDSEASAFEMSSAPGREGLVAAVEQPVLPSAHGQSRGHRGAGSRGQLTWDPGSGWGLMPVCALIGLVQLTLWVVWSACAGSILWPCRDGISLRYTSKSSLQSALMKFPQHFAEGKG